MGLLVPLRGTSSCCNTRHPQRLTSHHLHDACQCSASEEPSGGLYLHCLVHQEVKVCCVVENLFCLPANAEDLHQAAMMSANGSHRSST